MNDIDWNKEHILRIENENIDFESDDFNKKELRKKIEPWLTALFQSEHLSLLAGTGLTIGACYLAGANPQAMDQIQFEIYNNEINKNSKKQAKEMGRGNANIEDNFRVAMELYKGLLILENEEAKKLKNEINIKLKNFINNVLKTEYDFLNKIEENNAIRYLKSFLISFASRTATRERLNLFTTNYDRFIEYACDLSGILILDSFTGKIKPIFRTRKIELDYHYNPPGIRGEPRYVEGVVRYTKIHGSLDWRFENNKIYRAPLPFGAEKEYPGISENPFDRVVIYPNSSKGIETIYYPYLELFRDFSSAICRPNSVVVTYGYGFGDSHVNRIIEDMLTIPSTHLVIISYNKADGRIEEFVKNKNLAQITLLIGKHFGDLKTLVDNYLPKPAIDLISKRKNRILKDREISNNDNDEDKENDE